MLRPHEELPQEVAGDRSFTRIFLAGTIDMGNSRDWQKEIFERFTEMDGRYILFNPRQEHWDATRPGEMDYQVRWELDHLEEADMIIVMDNGKISAVGKHDELLESSEIYREVYEQQTNGGGSNENA